MQQPNVKLFIKKEKKNIYFSLIKDRRTVKSVDISNFSAKSFTKKK